MAAGSEVFWGVLPKQTKFPLIAVGNVGFLGVRPELIEISNMQGTNS
jgi:hypothetical protein